MCPRNSIPYPEGSLCIIIRRGRSLRPPPIPDEFPKLPTVPGHRKILRHLLPVSNYIHSSLPFSSGLTSRFPCGRQPYG